MLKSTILLDSSARKIIYDHGYPSLSYFIRLKIKELNAEKVSTFPDVLSKPTMTEIKEDLDDTR